MSENVGSADILGGIEALSLMVMAVIRSVTTTSSARPLDAHMTSA